MKTKEEMLRMLAVLTDEDRPYPERLEAYEYLLEDCDEIVDDMLEKFYVSEGETGKMLIEILAGYKGNPAIYMGLVSYLTRARTSRCLRGCSAATATREPLTSSKALRKNTS